MNFELIEKQALAHSEWVELLAQVALAAYRAVDRPSRETLGELRRLRGLERSAKAAYESALCAAVEAEETQFRSDFSTQGGTGATLEIVQLQLPMEYEG